MQTDANLSEDDDLNFSYQEDPQYQTMPRDAYDKLFEKKADTVTKVLFNKSQLISKA